MADKIKLEIEITQEQAALLAAWIVPDDIAGSSLEERIGFLVQHQCDWVDERNRELASIELHRKFNVRHPRDTPQQEF